MDAEERQRRIDEQLAESNTLMARIDASLERNDEALGRNADALERDRAVLARNEQAFLDLRAYMQQVTAALGLMVTDLREGRREQRESWDTWREEWRQESQAHRSALFAILDQLRNEPPPSPA